MRNMKYLRSKRDGCVIDSLTTVSDVTGRFHASGSPVTSSVPSISFSGMKHFPMRTETDQLALAISDLTERLVDTVSSTDPDWSGVIERFTNIVSLHKHSGILRGQTAVTMILWNLGFLLVRKLEASTANPALWPQAVRPLEVLSQQMDIDLTKEFASLGQEGE